MMENISLGTTLNDVTTIFRSPTPRRLRKETPAYQDERGRIHSVSINEEGKVEIRIYERIRISRDLVNQIAAYNSNKNMEVMN